jgi:hypothetical protein
MPIYQGGSLNPTALIVAGLYVNIVPPQISLLNGVPTNILGVVGSAQWGPKNSPIQIGGTSAMAAFAAQFGQIQPRKHDMGTAVAIAVQQGAQSIKCVRVTDGTDVAASANVTATDAIRSITVGGTITANDVVTLQITPNGGVQQNLAYTVLGPDTLQTIALALAALVNSNAVLAAAGIIADVPVAGVFNLHYQTAPSAVSRIVSGAATETVTIGSAATLSSIQISYASKWTGSLGNQISILHSAGSQAGTTKVSVTIPGSLPEIFDNIVGAGSVLWQNIVNAITLGQSGVRTPSQIITATIGVGASTPTLPLTVTPSGGTDGATGVTGATEVGVDTLPRTGMYALRSQGVSVAMLADCDEPATWPAQVSFGLFEGIYMICTGPAGETIASAAAAKTSAGIDAFSPKIMLGDWIYWQDNVNGQQRLVSPQAFIAGLMSNMSPQQSSLNKQIYGIVGTQKSITGISYATSDIATLVQAGIDVIGTPAPGGNYFAALTGHNSSSNPVIQGDNYTRMTNYIAATLNAGMGVFVGKTQSPTVQKSAKATLDAFFAGLWRNGLIGTSNPNTVPFNVILDDSNNPQSQVALGLMVASVQVIYLSIIEKFLINVEGGQTVTINRLSTAPSI